ncbi:peptidase M48 Ste24p [filamentous cyanobacterium CCP1]|nr:peptidase M48 Ste24p [filamentous cyanobacterium CCP1]
MTLADRLSRSACQGMLAVGVFLPVMELPVMGLPVMDLPAMKLPVTVAQSVEVEPSEEVDPSESEVEPIEEAEPLEQENLPEAGEPEAAAEDDADDEKEAISDEQATPDRADDAYFQLLIEADRLHQQGRRAEAEHLYRKAKGSFTGVAFENRPEPIVDPALLPPAGQVYWREANAGQEAGLLTRMLVPLELLVQEYPEFIPGTVRYAELLIEQERTQEALAVLERAVTLYPDQAELVRARVDALAVQNQWLDASIAARQFALFHPDHPAADEFLVLAEEHQRTFRSRLRSRLTGNAFTNLFTGAISFALTGGLFGPISAIDTAVLLLRGEEQVGESVARSAQRQLELVDDPEVVAYVNQIGQQLAEVTGRNEFEYEFFVVRDPGLNAFALPGGKIFINAGAIVQTNSEAELAGLIAHEIAHSALSHGFQLVTSSNVTASVFLPVPYAGGLATDLTVLGYSRDMERQADAFGTRLLAASGYAADGLYNLMLTLEEQNQGRRGLAWLSTHPDTRERIRNIETLIEENGYNRYTYEGVERHWQIRERVNQILAAEAADSEKKE